ncbi:hypothetical protein PHYSODRAFT_356163 [Phytophthora sojae]|uniref:Uncharacterized protein n=1 Tax=Phytophthora sojae (strain P6497) TaxID=1094619 RepID=G5AEP1_PHYSP|nr:hypothetical protein PHYSODRAFT_356163 [Phytophthora sojae]EGZ05681.1 hypothetical protein PHYSODRAFT_356163 [Phytophthora sojae]|eukprot:XP_009538542.1 hypothetical protein PHYSODRAFT_356163 [Phytophthora sojae]
MYMHFRYVPEFLSPLLISDDQPIMKTEARKRILERAAHVNMANITQHMVQKIELHAAKFVNATTRSEDMVYGEQKPIGAYFDAVHVYCGMCSFWSVPTLIGD